MRKKLTLIMNLVFFLCVINWALTGSASNVHAEPAEPLVVDGFVLPESVIHDEKADVYLVSNFGNPDLVPGFGFISRVRPDGELEELKWINNLNQPKGLAIDGDILYVSDVNVVRLFDRRTGYPLGEWKVPGAMCYNWLNDVAVGPSGTVYATDLCSPDMTPNPTDAMALYRFDREGNPIVMASGIELAGPNGIVANGDNLFVATMFGNMIYRTNSSGKIFPVVEVPGFFLDGLIRLTDGSLLVSSWIPPAIYKINPSRREVTTILDYKNFSEYFFWNQNHPLFSRAPADIGFDHVRNRILIPVLMGNLVVIYPME